LLNGANIEAQNRDNRTLLHTACISGHIKVVEVLLTKGANIEAIDKNKWTPLYTACKEGHVTIVEMLLSQGANLEAYNEDHQTPLYAACEKGHVPVVARLLEKSANIEEQAKDGETPLFTASLNAHVDVVNLLLNKGVNIDNKNKDGKTVLLLVSFIEYLLSPPNATRYTEIIQMLLSHGAQPKELNTSQSERFAILTKMIEELKEQKCSSTITENQLSVQILFNCLECTKSVETTLCLFCTMLCHHKHTLIAATFHKSRCLCPDSGKCKCV